MAYRDILRRCAISVAFGVEADIRPAAQQGALVSDIRQVPDQRLAVSAFRVGLAPSASKTAKILQHGG